MQCGLLGRKLGHSYSPQIHKMLGNYSYCLFEIEPENLSAFLSERNFSGLNVTIPYKKEVIPYCDVLSDRAKKLGAVNTLVCRDGKLIGHNTDYFGFLSMVQRSGISVDGKKVLVLGSGGASTTAVAVLQELGANVTVISRTGPDNYSNLDKHTDTAVIVNSTPVGMYPNSACSPVDLSVFPQLECVLDLIYNPANTKLLQDAQIRGIANQNGLWMLVAQAKESAEWFTGQQIPDSVIEEIFHAIRFSMENILLIGMPGCGKSTVGKLLAEKLNRPFIDADAELIDRAGTSIPEIFATKGETAFRNLETQVLADLGKASGTVIATGGGCVTQPENYAHLHQNSKIVWIQRKLDSLAVDGRPLSQANKLSDMFNVRKPLYEVFCDCTVCNDGDPVDTVTQILAHLKGGNL